MDYQGILDQIGEDVQVELEGGVVAHYIP
ncbi:MAG: hypothetical protein ACJAWF_002507, partial [Candidatus Azotimanducaceae bacterium]